MFCFHFISVDDIFDAKREQRHYQKNSFTVEKLYLWIQQVLEEHCGDSTAAAKFKDNDIDGPVFDELTPEELHVYLPKLGQRKKVKMMWEQLMGGLNSADKLKVDQGRNAEIVGTTDYQSLRRFHSINNIYIYINMFFLKLNIKIEIKK